MKRLILDHYRRWWWVLAIGAVYATLMGWSVAEPADHFESSHGKMPMSVMFLFVELKLLGRMVCLNTFCLAVFTGALLLSFDLQRGLARSVRALPLTARQTGRGWWLATAGIPGVVAVALLFLGAGLFCLYHPGKPFPLGRLATASLLTVLWFGTQFPVYFNKAKPLVFAGAWRDGLANLLLTALFIWMLFGFAFSKDAMNNPFKFGAFVLAGVVMTAIGWWRAWKFDPETLQQAGRGRGRGFIPGRAGSVLTPLSSADTRDLVPAQRGPGAISFLMRTTFTRIFCFIIITVVYAGLMFGLMGIVDSWDDAVRFLGGMAIVFWAIIFLQIMPCFQHLRFLRTLPISASRLAVVLMAMGMLPLLAVGVVAAGAAWLIAGPAAAITAFGGYAFTLAPAALCVCVGVWRGGGLWSSAFLLISLLGAFVLSNRDLPITLYSLITVVCIGVGFLLTRRALNCSRHAYLSRSAMVNPWCATAWDAGR